MYKPLLMVMFLISMMLSMFLMMTFNQMKELKTMKKEKKTPFECGFNAISMKKMSFSTNFLLISMLFLVFDVEISFLMPSITMNKNSLSNLMSTCLLFLSILTLMMMKEWKQGSLEWNQ